MRFRLRGPTGQSVITLNDDATLGDLNTAITKETSLSRFDIKIGFPPKTLDLDHLDTTKTLSDLDLRLNGEQLLVAAKDPAPREQSSDDYQRSNLVAAGRSKSQLQAGSSKSSAGGNNIAGSSSPSFSFGDLGSAVIHGKSPLTSSQKTFPAATFPAAQLALSRKRNVDTLNDPPEIALPEQGGTLVLRIMPDDNSCLFRAIASAIMPGLDTMNELRSVVAQAIQANPDVYSKAVLDNKEPDDYCRWIQTEAAWGGQIELNIISNHFDIEICSIDVQSLRIDRYNEGRPKRCIVVYSGIHYDTIALNPFDSPPEFDDKTFDSTNDFLLSSAVELCQMLNGKGYYTDTAAFQIRCKQCGTVCIGELGATEHASKTGHYSFDEGA
jgi:ubiquitin thioesterase OTU1